MFDIKSIRTFATSAKEIDKSVEFFTKVIGGKVVKTVEPTEEQLKAGQVKEVDVKLGNFEIHLFDASKGPLPNMLCPRNSGTAPDGEPAVRRP